MSRFTFALAASLCMVPFTLAGCGGGSEPVILPAPEVMSEEDLMAEEEASMRSRQEESQYD